MRFVFSGWWISIHFGFHVPLIVNNDRRHEKNTIVFWGLISAKFAVIERNSKLSQKGFAYRHKDSSQRFAIQVRKLTLGRRGEVLHYE